MRAVRLSFICLTIVLAGAFHGAHAASPIVGVNLLNAPYLLSPAEQETLLSAMQANGVEAIRAAIPDDERGKEFAKRVYAHGMRILWLIDLIDRPGSPWPKAPAGYESFWKRRGLTATDPDAFRATFGHELDVLENEGIRFVGFEAGNEFNWVGFNADFPLPGKGRIYGLEDLNKNPDARPVAQGFLRYLKTVAVLKDIRDRSKLNRHTPIVSGGLGVGNAPAGPSWNPHLDGVSIDATLEFLRAHGLDDLVDGYGAHTYPPAQGPGSAKWSAERLSRLDRIVFAQCRASGSGGKPCWLTEWGFNEPGTTCPVNDDDRFELVKEMREDFARYARQGRLAGLFFYTWQGQLHAEHEDRESAFLCGSLTPSGRLALAPL